MSPHLRDCSHEDRRRDHRHRLESLERPARHRGYGVSGIGSKVDYQRTVRRGATVDTIEEAFAFCLTGIEEEGITLPTIEIEPTLFWDEGEGEGTIRFDVSVAGPVEEPERDEGAEG